VYGVFIIYFNFLFIVLRFSKLFNNFIDLALEGSDSIRTIDSKSVDQSEQGKILTWTAIKFVSEDSK